MRARNTTRPDTVSRHLGPAWLAVAGVIALVLAGSHADGRDRAAEHDKITLGMSTALTGPAADLGISMRAGFLAGIEHVNRKGGFHGRTLALMSLDDGYEPMRTAPNMRCLINEKDVLAIAGNVGTPHPQATKHHETADSAASRPHPPPRPPLDSARIAAIDVVL